MTGGRRILLWVSLILGGIVLLAAGVFVTMSHPVAAGVWSGVVGVFIGLVGLAVSVYGVVLARRARPAAGSAGLVGRRARQQVVAARDTFTAAGDQHFDGAAGAKSGAAPAGDVGQDVRAGRDAFTAGGDQHFGKRRPR